MKRPGYRSAFRIYFRVLLLILSSIIVGVGFLLYAISIQKPNGESALTNWPQRYTQAFKEQIISTEDQVTITKEGMRTLKENELWIQIIDQMGKVVYDYNTSDELPTIYLGADLQRLCEKGTDSTPTICTGELAGQGKNWTYIIGYPQNIAKITMYVNGNRMLAGKTVIMALVLGILIVLGGWGIVYGYQLTKHITLFQKSTQQIATRAYLPIAHKGAFKELYDSLNQLDIEIRKSDALKEKNDQMREEWIANITHDLKTPLSSVKGYAELMLEDRALDGEKQHCVEVIIKNAVYIEALVSDLKLSYQLQNNMIPMRKKRGNLVRFLKEQVIDLLNHPEYGEAELHFDTNAEEIEFEFDPLLLKRAFQNLIVNAIVHNKRGTVIEVSIYKKIALEPGLSHERILIEIKDHGKGMDAEEVSKVFERYYRGSNKEQKPEGTGLGMAIAKGIIEGHGGQISLESEVNIGTKLKIYFG